jgi:hypothetical protein
MVAYPKFKTLFSINHQFLFAVNMASKAVFCHKEKSLNMPYSVLKARRVLYSIGIYCFEF